MTITQPCLRLYSFLKSVSSCMKGLTESWFILFSSCALQRVLSPLPRITGPHDWDGGWQGSMPHWIFHSSGSFNPPADCSLKPFFSLNKHITAWRTFTDAVCLQNSHMDSWVIPAVARILKLAWRVTKKKKRGDVMCVEEACFVLFI